MMKARVSFIGEYASFIDENGKRWLRGTPPEVVYGVREIEKLKARGGFSVEVLPEEKSELKEGLQLVPAPVPETQDEGKGDGAEVIASGVISSSSLQSDRPPVPRRKA